MLAVPRGPQGQKRPADVIGNAVQVAKIATGEIEEAVIVPSRQPNKAKGGRAGGKARAEGLSSKERSAIAKKAAAARWK